jgi:exodeoxyribonuclease VII large subunit
MPRPEDVSFSVSDFVAVFNQTVEYAYPSVTIVGELANFRISKNRWVYFDLKDAYASVRFFGTVFQLPGPLEDGMLLQVRGVPRLHQLYGFSITIHFIQPSGEGAIKKAADLLQTKLAAEGLFDADRKRPLPYPPQRIGLITSSESAAYADFLKILNARWRGIDVSLADVQVQGEQSVRQIVAAINYFNEYADPVDVLVLTRGGGSPEDLAAFSTEQVTRAVAGSRVPTMVAIGHEIDISLAELAADRRASTPSNAAELLVPDRGQIAAQLSNKQQYMGTLLRQQVTVLDQRLQTRQKQLSDRIRQHFVQEYSLLAGRERLLTALNPQSVLERGYAIIHKGSATAGRAARLKPGDSVVIEFADGTAGAGITEVTTT